MCSTVWGTIMTLITIWKSTVEPRKRISAKANPASSEVASVKTTTLIAMSTVFAKYRGHGRAAQARA